MQQWRENEHRCHHAQLAQDINSQLEKAGLFKALEAVFEEVGKFSRHIVIVTNAGSRTVDSFYLTYCLPQLRFLLQQHNVRLTSTEEWVKSMGPPPNPGNEDAFREFYTAVKYCEFKSRMEEYVESFEKVQDHIPEFDVISVGDQMCEISAACRLGETLGEVIRFLKLILILDPTNSRFSFQNPDQFVEVLSPQFPSYVCQQLRRLSIQILYVLGSESESLVETASNSLPERRCVSHWVPQPSNFTYSIGRPGRFPTEFPFYLPVDYLNIPHMSARWENESDSTIATDGDIDWNMASGTLGRTPTSQLRSVDPNSVPQLDIFPQQGDHV